MSDQNSAKTVEILEKLKSAILNIDWEISADNMGFLDQEISELRTAWQGQKPHIIYLQIMGALSQYISNTQEQANPAVFPLLRNVFDGLEDMVMNPSDEEQQTEKVMGYVDAYNNLKKAVASSRSKPGPEPVPEPESEPTPLSEPEVAEEQGQLEKDADEDQPSIINRPLDDKEDHTTDSIFDSMLDEMVQVELPVQAEEKPAPPPKAPSVRPPVMSAYNKDDGTEVEADRNIAEEFTEADALLDDFFNDDVPAPGAVAQKAGDEFDLNVLDADEGDGLDIGEDHVTAELVHVEDGDLDIFKIGEEAGKVEIAEPKGVDFPEMESALDDFFEHDESLPIAPEVEETLELETPSLEAAEVVEPAGDSGSSGTVADLKTLLLSVEWEVDDQLLDRIDAEIFALSDRLAGNESALIHLNFLKTVVHHVGREQSQVISESMACLKMVTESLEKLLSDEGGKDIWYVVKAVSSFVDWHELVVAEFEKRLEAAKKKGGALAESIEGLELASEEGETDSTQKLKKEILSEVREILSREMQVMRQELSAKD